MCRTSGIERTGADLLNELGRALRDAFIRDMGLDSEARIWHAGWTSMEQTLKAATVDIDHEDESLAFQTYETSISQPGGPTARFLTIPARAMSDPSILSSPRELAEMLGLLVDTEIYLADLPRALWEVLSDGKSMSASPRDEWPDEDRAAMNLCEYIAFHPSIPFEFSPQRSAALGAVVAAGAAAGAKVGLLVGAPGGPPLIIVTTTAGVVIGGLVGAVTWTLSEMLDERLSALLRRPRTG
jgi:hypothetical protein